MALGTKEQIFNHLEKGFEKQSFQVLFCTDAFPDGIKPCITQLKYLIEEWCLKNGYVFCQLPESNFVTNQDVVSGEIFHYNNERRNKLQFVFIKSNQNKTPK